MPDDKQKPWIATYAAILEKELVIKKIVRGDEGELEGKPSITIYYGMGRRSLNVSVNDFDEIVKLLSKDAKKRLMDKLKEHDDNVKAEQERFDAKLKELNRDKNVPAPDIKPKRKVTFDKEDQYKEYEKARHLIEDADAVRGKGESEKADTKTREAYLYYLAMRIRFEREGEPNLSFDERLKTLESMYSDRGRRTGMKQYEFDALLNYTKVEVDKMHKLPLPDAPEQRSQILSPGDALAIELPQFREPVAKKGGGPDFSTLA